ncbi:MAG: hypothetical protein ACJ746_14430 [Bryobacteraceae bacterium]
MMRVYRSLLRLYPESFRSGFGEEILTTLARLEAERASDGWMDRIVSSGREIAGLLGGSIVERFRVRSSRCQMPAIASDSDEIAAVEQSIRFHLEQTIDCIAHHRFDGARFHAREEDRARQRLRILNS